MSYQQRNITVQFTLTGDDAFDGSANVLTIRKARCHATFQSATGLSGINLSLSIWGLNKEYLTRLGTMGMVAIAKKRYRVKVWADEELFFEGVIATAYADFTRMPEVPLVLTANPSLSLQAESFQGFSAKGDQKAADIIESICSTAGLAFENNGVTDVYSNPHFMGNAVSCIYQVASAVGAIVELTVGKVTIWDKNVARDDVILSVSAGNGLLSYPTWAPVGLLITTVYTSKAMPGRLVDLKTDLPNASGRHQIVGVENVLSSGLVGGQWQTIMNMVPFNHI